jgi:hypothetical protein
VDGRLVQLNQKLYNNKFNELNEEEFDVYMLSRERESGWSEEDRATTAKK